MKLKELEDYEDFPKSLRQFQMDFIGTMTRVLKLYKPIATIIEGSLSNGNKKQIMDLCSGSGHPAIYIHKQLREIDATLLTDKFPQLIKENKGIIYVENSIDILTMSFNSQYFYTMYNAFHHFTDVEQKSIVSKLKSANASFLIVEILQPNLLSLLQVILASSLGQLLITPFIKPFSSKRLLFTYIIPINIFTVLFDGVVSVIKSKSVNAYKSLLLDGELSTNLEIKTIFKFPTTLTYIQGTSIT
jgi:hypothetical protein